MSYFAIKLYAMAFMLVDHIGYFLLNNDTTFRTLGRTAFPLFCFLLVNGYHHTKSRRKYLGRMITFALISEVAYDFALFGMILEFTKANVFMTLSLGLCGMILSDRINKLGAYIGRFIQLLLWIGLAIINNFINADYGWYGIVLIYFIYLTYGITQNDKMKMAVAIILASILYVVIEHNLSQIYCILSVAYIFMFEEKHVEVSKWKQIGCYWFYPVHLLCLALIRPLI